VEEAACQNSKVCIYQLCLNINFSLEKWNLMM
jgi:hypothetical protein